MRAHVHNGSLRFEDPISHAIMEVTVSDDGTICFLGDDRAFWIRTSDAASIGDWLRRTFASHDWRAGVDPGHTSIPVEGTP